MANATPVCRRLRALQLHTVSATAAGATTGSGYPLGGATPNSGATNRELRVPNGLSRCSGSQDLTPSAYTKTLEPDDCAFFREYGFLIKKQLLDPHRLAEAQSFVWDVLEGQLPVAPGVPVGEMSDGRNYQHSVSPGISRDDPDTWVGASVNFSGDSAGGLRSLGHMQWMKDLVPYDANVRAIVTQMLGPLRENRRVRGIYPIFPSEERMGKAVDLSSNSLGPHTDGQVCQLNAMCYLVRFFQFFVLFNGQMENLSILSCILMINEGGNGSGRRPGEERVSRVLRISQRSKLRPNA